MGGAPSYGPCRRAVVYAEAKQLIREWTSDDAKKALEPESLSLQLMAGAMP